jgi:hypothetical protein
MERAVRRERMGLEGVRTAERSDMSSMVDEGGLMIGARRAFRCCWRGWMRETADSRVELNQDERPSVHSCCFCNEERERKTLADAVIGL